MPDSVIAVRHIYIWIGVVFIMIMLLNESYNADKVKNLLIKYYTRYYLDYAGGDKAYAKECGLKHIEGPYGYDDEDYQEVADFLNSLRFPLTVYRGLKVKDADSINLGNKIGMHWTIDPEYIKNQTNLLKFTYVLIGEIDEKDINLEFTAATYLNYSRENPKTRYNHHREMEVTLKQRRQPNNLKIVPFDEFCDTY